MNIYDYVNAPELAAYIEEKFRLSNNTPLLGATLFPNERYLGTDISWLKGADSLPVTISPSNYDAKATMRERTSFGKVSTEMAFFREGTSIKEKERQEINKLIYHPNSALARPLIKAIFDDVAKIAEGVDIQAEYMRMQLIQYGAFEVYNQDKTARYKYDYNMSSDAKVTIANPWTDPKTSDPIADIRKACDDAEDRTGVRPSRAVMNKTTFRNMIASESIKKQLMIGVAGNYKDLYITDAEAKRYIEDKTELSIAIYNKSYASLTDDLIPDLTSAHIRKFIDNHKVVLLPNSTLGKTWRGTTPEESDLLTGAASASVSVLANGTAVTTFREPHPVNVTSIVSACMIPSFEMIRYVTVLTTGNDA